MQARKVIFLWADLCNTASFMNYKYGLEQNTCRFGGLVPRRFCAVNDHSSLKFSFGAVIPVQKKLWPWNLWTRPQIFSFGGNARPLCCIVFDPRSKIHQAKAARSENEWSEEAIVDVWWEGKNIPPVLQRSDGWPLWFFRQFLVNIDLTSILTSGG